MSLKVIFNPAAGHGKAAKYIGALEEIFKSRHLDYQISATKAPGHASDLAKEAAGQKFPKVVVAGGDGTISEVISGLVKSESILGIIPLGTGNDLVRSLKIPQNLNLAADIIFEGHHRKIDVGLDRSESEKGRVFVIALGVGFPSEVAYQENRERFFKGSYAFFVSVYKALSKLRSYRVKIEMEGVSFEMEMSLIMINNAPYCGGGQLMAPKAEIDDGLFDVITVDEISKIDLIYNFPKVYKGAHINHPKFKCYKTSWVRVYSEHPLQKMFDGDLGGTAPLEAEVLPQSLKVFAPIF